ncbi:glycosyltransferase family 39 protein [Fictibacillus enclensis]|uniref:glycosyltransferase family 39 protein n=1 Tax=Fictibacillus enclensis TaxID=1017270 RepID=UPI0025A1A8C0|nr:glycosyltransferase family 39 protein [Fictibacillus enclensis]MDM5337234.1 glycosyltransferase family 39 protein [Fictibacillus enclensis]
MMKLIGKWKIDYLLVLIVLFSAILNLYSLGDAGSNTYYTAAVKSMLQNFHAFFYGSLDSAGFITVDKPPVALWIQAASAYLLGVSDFSVLLPEALAGVISVTLMYVLIKPKFGRSAALISSLVLACSPIFVGVVRTNNVDSILILTLLIAAWALMKSVEKQKVGWLILSVVLVGVGFNIKMLQAYMVLPAFYLFYFLSVKVSWKKRILHLVIASVVLAGVSLSWAVVVDSVPKSERPYIGSSQTNSVLELALGYNGISRLTGNQGPGAKGGMPQGNGDQNQKQGQQSGSGSTQNNGDAGAPPNMNGQMKKMTQSGGMFGTGSPGVLRLFSSELSGQISWLLPLVLFGVIGSLVQFRRTKEFTIQHKLTLFWLAWLLPMMVFFSVAGFFHQYYLSMMGPAIAALVGTGWVLLWQQYKEGEGTGKWLLPVGILITFLFEALIVYQNKESVSLGWAGGAVLAGILAAALLFLRKIPTFKAALAGLLLALVLPLYWTVLTIQSGNSSLPVAGPSSLGFGGGMGGPPGMSARGDMPGGAPNSKSFGENGESAPADGGNTGSGQNIKRFNRAAMPQMKKGNPMNQQVNKKLISYLKKHYNGEKYLVATESSQSAAPIILNTDYAVMAMGGFSGSDPALTPQSLEKMVKAGEIKYFLISGGSNGRMGGKGNQEVNDWIKKNCEKVPSSEWSSNNNKEKSTMSFGPSQNQTLYVYKG